MLFWLSPNYCLSLERLLSSPCFRIAGVERKKSLLSPICCCFLVAASQLPQPNDRLPLQSLPHHRVLVVVLPSLKDGVEHCLFSATNPSQGIDTTKYLSFTAIFTEVRSQLLTRRGAPCHRDLAAAVQTCHGTWRESLDPPTALGLIVPNLLFVSALQSLVWKPSPTHVAIPMKLFCGITKNHHCCYCSL